MLKALKVRNSKLRGDQGGFTIVELIIVIAIAALILTIALAVVPALRRSGRNSARASDVSAMQAQIIEWSGNNGGKLPTATQFTNEVVPNVNLSHEWNATTYYVYSPTGTVVPAVTVDMPTIDQVHFLKGAKCQSDRVVQATAGTALKYTAALAGSAGTFIQTGTTQSMVVVRAIEGNDEDGKQIYTCVDDIQ